MIRKEALYFTYTKLKLSKVFKEIKHWYYGSSVGMIIVQFEGSLRPRAEV
jgi:hypothetical protein